MNNEIIYLDHAAATPLDERVLEAMVPYFSDKFYNPSSPYAPAVSVRRDLEQAKHQIAICIGASPEELVMTAGATESINLAILSIGGHIVTSSIEHPAVLETVKSYEHTLVNPDVRGLISAESVQESIKPNTRLVTVALANNELGTVQPIRDIAAVVKSEKTRRRELGDNTPIYFHIDASQGIGQLQSQVARLGVDMMTINSGKIYGPKQVGCLWADRSVQLKPQIFGGGQERGLRSGTENVAGIIGFAKALQLAVEHQKSEAKRLADLRDKLQHELEVAFPEMIVSGHKKLRLPGFLHVAFDGIDAERLVFGLEMRGVMVATGSACAANKGTRSHVLTAIGMEPAVADGSMRLSLGRLTNEQNIATAAKIIIEVVREEKKRVAK